MIFSRINLRKALVRERDHQQRLLSEAQELLRSDSEADDEILTRLRSSSNNEHIQSFTTDNLFSIEEIRNICIRYRLRFLDSSQFRSEYPYPAIAEIKKFEKAYGIKIHSFKIMAPSKAFDLENINKDPLLFAQVSDYRYYLIHQWGHDLAWHRKILSWPLQNFKTLMIFLLIVCAIFAFSIPSSIMNVLNFQGEIYLRIWLTIHTFIGLLGFALWGGLTFSKNFSKHEWDSKYYNY